MLCTLSCQPGSCPCPLPPALQPPAEVLAECENLGAAVVFLDELDSAMSSRSVGAGAGLVLVWHVAEGSTQSTLSLLVTAPKWWEAAGPGRASSLWSRSRCCCPGSSAQRGLEVCLAGICGDACTLAPPSAAHPHSR